VESNIDGVEIYLDDKLVKVINKNEPLLLEGLEPRAHRVKAVKMGYEPFVSEEMVYPNQKSAVSVRILVQRRPNRTAVDSLDRGKELYSKGFKQNYELAIAQFTKALQLDPTYSEAALYLGRTYNALYDEPNAEKYFRLAIKLDPDYLEAHAGLGAMLLDLADTDGAVREFNSVLQRKPNDPVTLTNLAQAYRMKGLYSESVESARKAVSFAPEYAEPHLWMGESLRLSAHYDASLAEYGQYLKLSNFQSKLSGQLNYYVVGYLIGMGKKNRATQQDIWKDLRNLAWFGSCDCERKLKHYDLAIPDCQKALTYDPSDAYTHYALALSYAGQGAHVGSYELLAAAVQHFQAMLQLNPDLQEAGFAKQNISSLQKALSSR
jgi:tetratricopeptide (TPR) repeat protein